MFPNSQRVVLVANQEESGSFLNKVVITKLCVLVNLLSSRFRVHLQVVARIGNETIIGKESCLQRGCGVEGRHGERDNFSLRSLHNDVETLLLVFRLLFHCRNSNRHNVQLRIGTLVIRLLQKQY